jgi:ABC-type nitrate/sulfonate/bicarbonate transport system substrate-binding protein
MKRKLAVGLIIILVVSLLAGCSNEKTKSTAPAQQKVTVMLDWFPNTNHTGLYVAKDKGYFEQEGLDVEIVQPGEGGNPQLVASGKAEFAVSYQEEVTVARSQDVPVVAIAAVIQHNTSGFASPADRNIKTPKDFEGKTYGGWGSPSETAMLKVLMSKYGADVNKVTVVNIGSSDFFAAVQKDVDFSWIFQGWTGIQAQEKGMKLNYINLRDEDKAFDFYTPVLITSEKMVADNPELVSKFTRAVSKGYQFAIDHPDQAAGILLKNAPELDQKLVNESQKYLAGQYKADASRWGEMKTEVWKQYADFMFNNQLIDKNIVPEQSFTNKFLP